MTKISIPFKKAKCSKNLSDFYHFSSHKITINSLGNIKYIENTNAWMQMHMNQSDVIVRLLGIPI